MALGHISSLSGARAALEDWEKQKPERYASRLQSQIDALTDQLGARRFTYELRQDPAYRLAERQYRRSAERAGENAQAAVSALGGGYGSSYAATAGANAYQNVMNGLDSVANGLYSQALSEYGGETSRLQNLLGGLQQQESTDYDRYQKQLADWYDQLSYLQAQADGIADSRRQRRSNALRTGGNVLGSMLSAVVPYVLAYML